MKIKKCPFCNGEGRYLFESNWADCHVVECVDCGASGSRSDESKEEAIELWNKRKGEGGYIKVEQETLEDLEAYFSDPVGDGSEFLND